MPFTSDREAYNHPRGEVQRARIVLQETAK